VSGECVIKPGETLTGQDRSEYLRTVLKGRNDPIWWIKTYLGTQFEPYHTTQETILREWYRHKYNPALTPYKYMFLMAGMRSGKTALNSMITCYELFDIASLPKDPWDYYGLIRDQLVTCAILSISRDQSDDGMWGNVSNYLESCQWFKQWTDMVVRSEEANMASKHIGLRVFSSSTGTNIGRSNRFVGLDELDSFESNEGKRGQRKVYNKMSNSIQTFGADGRLSAISSSNDDPNSIMNTLIAQTKDRDEGTPYEKRTFLAITKPTWVMNTAIKEADLREEYKDDLGAFYRDFACLPGMYTGMEFPDGVSLLKMDNVLKTKVFPMPGQPRVVSIDPSAKNDAFGVGTAYRDGMKVIVDGVDRFTKHTEDIFINAEDIDKYLSELYLSANVRWLITDTWMYPNLVQKAMGMGIKVVKHIVYKEDYDRVKGMIKEGTCDVVFDPILKRELLGLKVINDKKVDHPLQGSKDMADTVANCVWALTNPELMVPVKPKILLAVGW
jgi:hypothetical protein